MTKGDTNSAKYIHCDALIGENGPRFMTSYHAPLSGRLVLCQSINIIHSQRHPTRQKMHGHSTRVSSSLITEYDLKSLHLFSKTLVNECIITQFLNTPWQVSKILILLSESSCNKTLNFDAISCFLSL